MSGSRAPCATMSGSFAAICCRSSGTIVCLRSRSPRWIAIGGRRSDESASRAEALAEWHTRVEETQDPARRREVARERPLRPLGAVSINKTITRLGQILEVALEYGLIDRNTARGKRRRLKVSKPCPVWLDRAEHVEALLDAASELDQHARVKGGHDQKGGLVYRRALLATFVLAGLANRRDDSPPVARR